MNRSDPARVSDSATGNQDLAPFVSVVIPLYHDWEGLRRCLTALAQQDYPRDRFEVVVVNNDPEDSSTTESLAGFMLSRIPSLHVHMIPESQPGSYAARNTGVRSARGMIIAFTDSDCIPQSRWLSAAVEALCSRDASSETSSRFDCVDRVAGEIQLFFQTPPGKRTAAELYEYVFGFEQAMKVANHGACATANLVTTRAVFEAVGEFNDRMLSGGDLEWGWRARDAGYTIRFVSEAVVLHPARATLKELFAKRRRVLGGSVALNPTKHLTPRFFLTGFLPPFHQYVQVARRAGLTGFERVRLGLFLYLIKLHKTVYTIKLHTGIAVPQRS